MTPLARRRVLEKPQGRLKSKKLLRGARESVVLVLRLEIFSGGAAGQWDRLELWARGLFLFLGGVS